MNQPRNPNNRPLNDGPDGAHAIGGDRRKKGWLWWLLLPLLLLAALIIWLIARNNNDDNDPAPTTTPTTVVTANPVTSPLPTGPVGNTPPLNSANANTASTARPTITTTTPAPTSASTSASATTVNAANPATTTAASPATTSSAATSIPPGGANATGPTTRLIGNGQDLVAIATNPAALQALTTADVTGQATVQSVVSDEGFWVGDDPTNRVFVQLAASARGTTGESPFQVTAGQVVAITGVVTPAEGRIPADVTEEDGLTQLRQQAVFIEANTLQLIS